MEHTTTTRASITPLLALVLAILSFSGCIVTGLLVQFVHFSSVLAFLALPLLSFTALVLSLRILLTTKREDATAQPFTRGPALLAFLIALLAAIGQLAIVGTGLAVYLPMKRLVLPAADEMVRAIAADRPEKALDAFATAYQSRITPQELDTLFQAVTDEIGPIQSVRFELATFERARDTFSRLSGTTDLGTENPPKPVELRAAKNDAMLWILLDESALAREQVRFQDLLIVLPDLRALTLFPDGRMKLYAENLGLSLINWRTDLPPSGAQSREQGDSDRQEQHRGNESTEPRG